MKLVELYKTERCSVESDVDGRRYGEAMKLLARYHFWPGSGSRKYGTLWEHQDAAISSCIAYLCSDRSIPAEEIRHEAALVKMATGTGKSAIIAVLSRCLPDIKRILILTPREALREQLYAYVRRGSGRR
jgi:superfamily II DNA or RNA helicase